MKKLHIHVTSVRPNNLCQLGDQNSTSVNITYIVTIFNIFGNCAYPVMCVEGLQLIAEIWKSTKFYINIYEIPFPITVALHAVLEFTEQSRQ